MVHGSWFMVHGSWLMVHGVNKGELVVERGRLELGLD